MNVWVLRDNTTGTVTAFLSAAGAAAARAQIDALGHASFLFQLVAAA